MYPFHLNHNQNKIWLKLGELFQKYFIYNFVFIKIIKFLDMSHQGDRGFNPSEPSTSSGRKKPYSRPSQSVS